MATRSDSWRIHDGGVQKYNGMLLSLQRRVARGVSVTGNYTWSRCQGNYVDINQNGPPANETYSKPGDRNFDNGNCLSDRRQIFNATAIAQTPRFSNSTLNVIASNWTLGGIYRFSTGAPINVVSGTDQALTGTVLQRANQVAANPYKDKSGGPLTQWVDPAAFAAPLWVLLAMSVGTALKVQEHGPSTSRYPEHSRFGKCKGSKSVERLST